MRNLKIFLIALAALSVLGCSTAYKSLTASMPNMSLMANGVYRGEYDVSATPVKVVLDVTVQGRQITEINIVRHNSSPIGKRAERIIDQIIEEQSLDIDVISGATASSKAILKAVENALQ